MPLPQVGYWHLTDPQRLQQATPWLVATAAALSAAQGEGPARAPSS
jgi:hypothetical protein